MKKKWKSNINRILLGVLITNNCMLLRVVFRWVYKSVNSNQFEENTRMNNKELRIQFILFLCCDLMHNIVQFLIVGEVKWIQLKWFECPHNDYDTNGMNYPWDSSKQNSQWVPNYLAWSCQRKKNKFKKKITCAKQWVHSFKHSRNIVFFSWNFWSKYSFTISTIDILTVFKRTCDFILDWYKYCSSAHWGKTAK